MECQRISTVQIHDPITLAFMQSIFPGGAGWVADDLDALIRMLNDRVVILGSGIFQDEEGFPIQMRLSDQRIKGIF